MMSSTLKSTFAEKHLDINTDAQSARETQFVIEKAEEWLSRSFASDSDSVNKTPKKAPRRPRANASTREHG